MGLVTVEKVESKHGAQAMVETTVRAGPSWANWWRCPLIPQFWHRTANEWNTTSWNFHWLIFRFWTIDSLALSLEVKIEDDLAIRAHLPYCLVGIFIPLLPSAFLQRFWRRPPGRPW